METRDMYYKRTTRNVLQDLKGNNTRCGRRVVGGGLGYRIRTPTGACVRAGWGGGVWITGIAPPQTAKTGPWPGHARMQMLCGVAGQDVGSVCPSSPI
jgi:hypothetical protein